MSENEDTSGEEEEKPKDLETLFNHYARFGDPESKGSITLENIDKWLKQAGILDQMGGVTNADTAITFLKIVNDKKRMDVKEFQEFIETLAINKKVEPEEFIDKLIVTGKPKHSSITTPIIEGAAGRNLRRLTDPELHTGAQEEPSDEEGKGKEDRTDTQSDTGYDSGYEKDVKDQNDEKDKADEKDDKDKNK